MTPFYYKYIDPIIDYLQPLPKILGDTVVISTLVIFGFALVVWWFCYKQSCKE